MRGEKEREGGWGGDDKELRRNREEVGEEEGH